MENSRLLSFPVLLSMNDRWVFGIVKNLYQSGSVDCSCGPPLTLEGKRWAKKTTLSTVLHVPSMAHLSPVSFPFVYSGIEHGVDLSPVLSTSLVKIFVVAWRGMRVYSVDHFFILAKFRYLPGA
jgi:hypothetical protein